MAAAGHRLDEDWERLVTFYAFPKAHWKHVRITNVVESPFAAVRLRTAAAKRFKKVENATAVIWKTLLVAEQTCRRLDAPELLRDVAEGVAYVGETREKRGNAKAAARLGADRGRWGRVCSEVMRRTALLDGEAESVSLDAFPVCGSGSVIP